MRSITTALCLVAALVAVLGQYGHGPLWHQTSGEPLWWQQLGIPCSQPGGPGSFVACHLTITDPPSGPDAPMLHLTQSGTARFVVDSNGRVVHLARDGQLDDRVDFSGFSMDTVTTFPEIKRTGADMLIQLGQDESPPTFTLRGSGLIAAPLHQPSTSDACKDALRAVMRSVVDTLAGHPNVATGPLLRWAADQCEDQPAEEPNR